MKRSLKDLDGFSLKEPDGEIGKVVDFYFDDLTWTIRYLIIKTGGWLSEKQVLISPSVVTNSNWDEKELTVRLTKSQIENSPDIDTAKPVSRQQEEQLAAYYPWDSYWGNAPDEHGAGIFGAMPSELYDSENVVEETPAPVSGANEDPHLRSAAEIIGYTIHTTDGEIGKVNDFIMDDNSWKILFLIVDTGTWLDRERVLLSPKWISGVNWENQVVIVSISTDAVRNSPDYNSSDLNDEANEKNLHAHYGKQWP